ncbi:MAG: flavin monoamine oxidase family protein [Ignavibacteriae bacterium]|nr:flavin monoamine oxidase family protein [Ignavibacteriota bacterium]
MNNILLRDEITRREFLQRTLLATSATVLYPNAVLAQSQRKIERKGPSKKIIILGAGLAGLSAGYELTNAGHEVIIVEARTRPGGRLYTMREPFSDGMYAELGATRIPENHQWTMHYVSHFGLDLDEFRPTNLNDMLFLRGKRIITSHGEEPEFPVELTPEEKELGVMGMRQKYINPILKEVGDVTEKNWLPPASLLHYDSMTWREFLRHRGASVGAVELLTLGHSAGLYNEVSALQMLRVSAEGRKRRQMYKIRGGNDKLPQVFVERMKDIIHFNSPVVKIEQNAETVRTTMLNSGKQETIVGDYLICTIPFPVLRTIAVTPAFSPNKVKAIEKLWYTSIARVNLQTKTKFWLDENLSGFVRTDLPIMETWDISHNIEGKKGMLLAYASGTSAQQICDMSENVQISFVLDQIEQFFPQIKKEFEVGNSFCWQKEEWSKGAWAWLKPGQYSTIASFLSTPEGRIHFAGDHTSVWSSWMQGAFESGYRAANEVNNL